MTCTVAPRLRRSRIAPLVFGAARTRRLSSVIVAVTGGGGWVGGGGGMVGTTTACGIGATVVDRGRVVGVGVAVGTNNAVRLVIWHPRPELIASNRITY